MNLSRRGFMTQGVKYATCSAVAPSILIPVATLLPSHAQAETPPSATHWMKHERSGVTYRVQRWGNYLCKVWNTSNNAYVGQVSHYTGMHVFYNANGQEIRRITDDHHRRLNSRPSINWPVASFDRRNGNVSHSCSFYGTCRVYQSASTLEKAVIYIMNSATRVWQYKELSLVGGELDTYGDYHQLVTTAAAYQSKVSTSTAATAAAVMGGVFGLSTGAVPVGLTLGFGAMISYGVGQYYTIKLYHAIESIQNFRRSQAGWTNDF